VTKGSLPRDIFFKKEDDEIYQWDVDTARTMNVSRSSLGSATDVMSPRNQNGRAGKSVNWTLSPHHRSQLFEYFSHGDLIITVKTILLNYYAGTNLIINLVKF